MRRTTWKFILLLSLALSLQSCHTAFLQVYEAEPVTEMQQEDDALVFEDEHCVITYNLWSEHGDPGFELFNKTDKTLYLDKLNSYFVINGEAKDYYLDRVFTSNASASVTSAYFNFSQGSSSGVNYQEKAVVAVPAGTHKKISEHNISATYYRECNMEKYPSKRQVKTTTYSAAGSPFRFENRITYFFDEELKKHQVTNAFYVSSITNYPLHDVMETTGTEKCSDHPAEMIQVISKEAAHRFYVEYSRSATY